MGSGQPEFDLIVAIDISVSITIPKDQIIRDVNAYIDGRRAKVYFFNHRIDDVIYTSNISSQMFEMYGRTALWDCLHTIIRDSTAWDVLFKPVVVFTDGEDNSSRSGPPNVINLFDFPYSEPRPSIVGEIAYSLCLLAFQKCTTYGNQ
jgi:hypothetical protein